MPKKGSQWVLFLEREDNDRKIFITYRGDYGRRAANVENLGTVKYFLSEHSKTADLKEKVINAALRKILDDYYHQKDTYGGKLPDKISIALVEREYAFGEQLERGNNIEKHWLWQSGILSEADEKIRQDICNDKTYHSYSIVTLAIFTEEDKILIQLDEQWFAQNGERVLYEVITAADDGIDLKALKELWVS